MTPSDDPRLRQDALLSCLSASSKASDASPMRRNAICDMLAKTARLREQRLARDAAEAETAKKNAKPKRPA